MKHVAWVAAASVISLGMLFACGGAESSDVLAGRSNQQVPGSDAGDEASSTSSSSSSSGTTSSSGGTEGGTDGAAATNAFTGAPAYTARTGKSTSKPGEHPNGGNPAKVACLSCHVQGGEGPRFFAGGTVYKDTAATIPAPQVEVRFRDGAGNTFSTYTDALGNFLVTAGEATSAGITFPLQVGARDATSTKLMSASITSGDCNSAACHGGAQGFVHVP